MAAQQARRRAHSDMVCTHRQAYEAVYQPVRNLQTSIHPSIQLLNQPASFSLGASICFRGMWTNSAALRNKGSGNTIVRVILGIPAFQWGPLCLSVHCPVMKTTQLIGLLLCVCVCVCVIVWMKHKNSQSKGQMQAQWHVLLPQKDRRNGINHVYSFNGTINWKTRRFRCICKHANGLGPGNELPTDQQQRFGTSALVD